jgi:tellurite resistance protein TerC
LADLLDYLRYLGIGLAIVLMFVGVKMIADPWWHITEALSLLVVGGILVLTATLSLWAGPKKQPPGPPRIS